MVAKVIYLTLVIILAITTIFGGISYFQQKEGIDNLKQQVIDVGKENNQKVVAMQGQITQLQADIKTLEEAEVGIVEKTGVKAGYEQNFVNDMAITALLNSLINKQKAELEKILVPDDKIRRNYLNNFSAEIWAYSPYKGLDGDATGVRLYFENDVFIKYEIDEYNSILQICEEDFFYNIGLKALEIK